MKGKVVGVIEGLNEVLIQFYDSHGLQHGDIIDVTDEKKTLTQLGYYRSLVREIARKLGNSEACQHNLMLRRMHIYKKYNDKYMYVVLTAEDSEVLEDVENHLEPTRETKVGKDGLTYTTYLVLKGTRSYTKEEMSKLIEETVDEAKRQDIPTMSEAVWRRLRVGL